nr:MAG TPA_asm: hypothetical protein [Caudoviricetes sp.]
MRILYWTYCFILASLHYQIQRIHKRLFHFCQVRHTEDL